MSESPPRFSESSLREFERHEQLHAMAEHAQKARRLTSMPTNDTLVRLKLRSLAEPMCLWGEGPAERRDRLRDVLVSRRATNGTPTLEDAQQLGGRGLLVDASIMQLIRTAEAAAKAALAAAAAAATKSGSGAAAAAAAAAAVAGSGLVLEEEEDQDAANTVVYTPGSTSLRDTRLALAQFSLARAADRLAAELRRFPETSTLEPAASGTGSGPPTSPARAASEGAIRAAAIAESKLVARTRRRALHNQLVQLTNQSSEVGGERPLSWCSFSPDGSQLAVADWSGTCKVWRTDSCSVVRTLRGHTDRVNQVLFHAGGARPGRHQLFSCGADNAVLAWDCPDDRGHGDGNNNDDDDDAAMLDDDDGEHGAFIGPSASFGGHTARVNRLAVHPNGQLLASTSHDETWKLWDINRAVSTAAAAASSSPSSAAAAEDPCLLHQTGHFCPVFALAFQCDGALLATGGLDGVGLLWDLRSGKQIWQLMGHVSSLMSLDFHPNGYHLASGGGDNAVRVWDLRAQRTVHVVAAHRSLVSCVRWEPSFGDFLASSSFDNTVKFWDVRRSEVALTKTLSGHEGKVMSFDIAKRPAASAGASTKKSGQPHDDELVIASSSYDRTWKIWAIDKDFIDEDDDDEDDDNGDGDDDDSDESMK